MKRSLFSLAIPVLIIFTGAAYKPGTGIHTSKRTHEAATAGIVNIPTGSCGSLIFFQKGAVVKFATYDSAGKEMSKQTSTVTDVINKAGILIGMVKMENTTSMGSNTKSLEYKCDGKSLSMDLNAVMANFAVLKGAKASATTLDFPINLSVGQSLPDASVTIEMERGKMKMKTTATHTDRKVEKIEEVKTAAGNYTCYKVSSNIKTSMDMGNAAMNQAMVAKAGNGLSQKMVAWWSPDFGVVKMESYLSGKMVSRSVVLSVKK